MADATKRKVTLMYRSKSARGDVVITSDQAAAKRHGDIERIYRSKRDACPAMTVCTVPKNTAPWEIASELEPLEVRTVSTGKVHRATYQLTDMGDLGELLLKFFSDGDMWDDQIIIVPDSLVPAKEKSSEGTADAS